MSNHQIQKLKAVNLQNQKRKEHLSKMMIPKTVMSKWKERSFHFEAVMAGLIVTTKKLMHMFIMKILPWMDSKNWKTEKRFLLKLLNKKADFAKLSMSNHQMQKLKAVNLQNQK